MEKYLVYLEQRDGVVKKSSIVIWNALQGVAALHQDVIVSGILVGAADLHQLSKKMYGQGVIYHASDQKLGLYNSEHYARIVAELFQRGVCSALFFADSILSRELAPKLSLRLKASLLSGTLLFDESGAACGTVRAVYSASALASFYPQHPLRIYTIDSCALPKNALPTDHIEFKAIEPYGADHREDFFPLLRRIVMREGVQDLTEAAIIVAGGRGIGGAEGFVLLDQLAFLLGGVVGATRPVVDEGWRPHSEQIGQTGKTVAPILYFACGISGSVQHLAGIASDSTVVAINSDCHAPIFEIAEYGIVGDVHLVLPKLIAALHDFLKKK